MEGSPIRVSEDNSHVTGVDPQWLSRETGLPVKDVTLEPLNGAGGLSATMYKVSVRDEDGKVLKTLILKTLLGDKQTSSRSLGLYREANFYNEIRSIPKLDLNVPEVVYAFGDKATGRKLVLMEDVSDGTQSGYFFGPGSPLNVGKDLENIVRSAGGATAVDMCRLAVCEGAKLHSAYWNKVEQLGSWTWLRGLGWYQGRDQEAWEQAQKYAAGSWEAASEKISSGESSVTWEPELLELMNASLCRTSWEEYQERVKGSACTLVHGDYHPGNMMYTKRNGQEKLLVLDWELVGVGSGPQDIAQYMISHASPDTRRSCEEDLLRQYHSELVHHGVQTSLEHCRAEYISGGLERWIWLFACLCTMVPDAAVQYFHDQVFAFMKDHKIDASCVGQPRP